MLKTIDQPQPKATGTTARAALDAQLAGDSRHFGFSLDDLHRACGTPENQTPADWFLLVRPVLDGFRAYRRRLHEATFNEQVGGFIPREVTWTVDSPTLAAMVAVLGSIGPFRIGDQVVDEEVASLYALFLDHAGLRRNLTTTGRQEHNRFLTKLSLMRSGDRVRIIDPAPVPIFKPAKTVAQPV